MIIKVWTDRSGQTVQTQIRLLLEEQSDLGLHYLQYCLNPLDALLYSKISFFKFKDFYSKVFWRQKLTISIYKEDNVFIMTGNLLYGPPVNTDIDYY